METYFLIRVLVLYALALLCTCYPYFQESLPNGKNVPHPCISGHTWEGVGHENQRGAGTKNIFGVDFKNNNLVWDAVICNKDSDGDGKTNGEELGDPDCSWTPGSSPKYTTGLSHPGICEPFESPQCGGKPSFVNCEDSGTFQCDAINEPDTFNFTVRFPETPVPAKETTYICITFELPMDKEYHLVATNPYIDNKEVMHHTLAFGCDGADKAPRALNEPVECGGTMGGCRELIAAWGAGGTGNCLDRNMGFLIGANKGLKYGVMQHHWNNPQEIPDYKDSSGMTFYLTPNLRPNNAGFLMTGQFSLDIPPGESYYSASGSCGGSCLSQIMDGPIYVSQVNNHMHLLGTAQFTELRRNSSFARYLAQDKVYDYNTPVSHIHRDPVMVHPGDELKTTCIFSSETRKRTTNFGDATSDEMCLAFFTYYPEENMRTGHIVYSIIFSSDPETLKIITSVNELCDPGKCRQECFDYVKELKKHPCFSGDVGKYLRSFSARQGTDALERIAWYARLDSCDVELLREQYDDINGGRTAKPLYAMILFSLICLVF
ncbi:DBH-like monooxygenase protein 1 homolog [Mercenaria mercenaria]|uniref:DBH-like monooxygenase protein 1 homolog n=1 Tax=Mercenaria mercenaria TaxID=6596 RepID=UPI00234EA31F|nr:DBH-like monooxygenase protein 1 homolog [Mercenaria mercenaria]